MNAPFKKPKTRRRFSEIEVIDTLIHQDVIVCCYRCKIAFRHEDVKSRNIQKEHLHERELDGPDEPFNCRFSHKDCHAVITNGTPATSAGSSKNRIAKANHPNRTEKFIVNKPPLDAKLIQPVGRCSRCGEYAEDCQCPELPARSSFGRKTPKRAWGDRRANLKE